MFGSLNNKYGILAIGLAIVLLSVVSVFPFAESARMISNFPSLYKKTPVLFTGVNEMYYGNTSRISEMKFFTNDTINNERYFVETNPAGGVISMVTHNGTYNCV